MVAFFVDGHMEQRFIQRICPGKVVRRIECNGRDVSVPALAKRIGTLWRSLGERHYPLVVWVDLENRSVSFERFREDLHEACVAEGVPADFLLGVADRMIENWILSDRERAVQSFGIESFDGYVDGQSGKCFVKRFYPEYHETTDGVEALCGCRCSEMIKNSESFRVFYESVLERIDSCWWLAQ